MLIKNKMIKKIGVLFLGLVLLSFVSAENNLSTLYGENDSGAKVPILRDNNNQIKMDIDLLNLTAKNVATLGNLTFSEQVTFTLGGMIDNIVDGWIRMTGNLNVTGNNLTLGGKLLQNDNGTLRWGGIDLGNLNVSILYGQDASGSFQPLSIDEDRKLVVETYGAKTDIWEIVGGVVQLVTSGDVYIEGNLNVTGNLSGGSPVKIIGGLRVINDSGSDILFVNATNECAEFNGNVNIGNFDNCDSTNEGALRYNSSLSKMQFCDSTNWIQVDV